MTPVAQWALSTLKVNSPVDSTASNQFCFGKSRLVGLIEGKIDCAHFDPT